MKKSVWKHKKYPAREYVGNYKIYGRERAFKLSYKLGKKKHHITFESHQAAKALGWKKK